MAKIAYAPSPLFSSGVFSIASAAGCACVVNAVPSELSAPANEMPVADFRLRLDQRAADRNDSMTAGVE